ncbi:MAG TPA: hypothetical protein VFV75_20680 [Candidatus Polarisedimenticolaceae bacterium]|nr:hypothetical protein [Candidatus Polarisedimenticolaceae bacterium]
MHSRQPGSVLTKPSIAAAMVRGASVTLVILATGACGLAGLFTDQSPGESVVLRFALLVLVQVLGAALVGWLVPRWWILAVLTAWGPLLLGGVGLYVKLRHDTTMPSLRFFLLSLVLPPLLALAGGLLGRWWTRRTRSRW